VAAWPHHLDYAHSGWHVTTAALAALRRADDDRTAVFVEGDILGGQTAAFSPDRTPDRPVDENHADARGLRLPHRAHERGRRRDAQAGPAR
jgi:hypothetical protein